MKYRFFLGPISIALLWFFDGFQNKNLFAQATYGWFRPSPESVNFTLLMLFIASFLFVFISLRLNKSIIISYSILIMAFVFSYLSFVILKPSANGIEFSGILLSLLYGAGKYGTLVIVLVSLGVFVIKKQKNSSNLFKNP